MKRILFVAPHSFPIKSSESICNSKVAYILAEAGYIVDVFSCSDKSTYPADVEYNERLSNSKNLNIYTIRPKYIISRKDKLYKIIINILYNFWIFLTTGYFYNGISIPYMLLKTILKHIDKHSVKYDVILTRGFNTDLVGITLVKKYGIKWIANWNDPFPNKRFPAPYGDGYNARLPYFEYKVIRDIQKYASLHTFPNNRLRDYMLKCFPNISVENTLVIPHMALSTLSMSNYKGTDNRLKIVHCGYLKSPRNPELFIRALAQVKSYPKYKDLNFTFYIVGSYDNNVKQLIHSLKLESNIEIINNLSYKDSMDFISKCNVSLIIEAQCEEGIYLPTKVVDAIQCKLPILCISPNVGVLNDMINKYSIGYFADNTSIEQITKVIDTVFSDFLSDKLPKINVSSIPEIFEMNIAEQYRSIL